MTTPCLTRQNAFLVEDYEVNSPLDWFCSICCQVSESELVQPCNCVVKSKPYLAHEKCFLDWSDKNGRPRYCTRCKGRYSPTRGYSRLEKFVFVAVTSVSCFTLYLIVHVVKCSTIKTFQKVDIELRYGTETFSHVPDRLTMPTISAQCWKSSFVIHSFFISFSYFVTLFSFSFLVALVATRYIFHSQMTN
ncbi:uncharacterized protein EV154DRAFT_498529, partial [Mucor mucedo]|uniref:uncharacterized protein n=1 Tax=Mucor mucedo TaxID=29922 RepID=UPI00221F64E9